MCLFPEVGYRLVWNKLTAGLSGMPVVCPSAKALRDLRRRIGSAPVRALFELLAGLLARPTTPGVRFGAYRVVWFDGCSSLRVPDSERNRAWLGRTSHHGYPTLELMTLTETGSRALVGAVFGPTAESETSYARRLASAAAGHADAVGQGIRQQRLPRARSPTPAPRSWDGSQQPAPAGPHPPRRRLLSVGDRRRESAGHRRTRPPCWRGSITNRGNTNRRTTRSATRS
ncbi:transposase domain-containing protein [Streptomyces sp. NPDC088747]|uniref:transposase domain-containing protein n=1 Tax=Streptomyces sp. NPDC088747 TaxID=3365886 RepID=UPI0037FA1F11